MSTSAPAPADDARPRTPRPVGANGDEPEWLTADGEADDDDMDYEPTTEADDEDNEDDDDDDDAGEDMPFDGENVPGGMEIEFTLASGEEEEDGEGGLAGLTELDVDGAANAHITRRGLLQLLRGDQVFSQLVQHFGGRRLGPFGREDDEEVDEDDEDDDDDDDDDDGGGGGGGGGLGMRRRRRPRGRSAPEYPKPPSAVGTELMGSGDFGTNDLRARRSTDKQKRLASRLLRRELGLDGQQRERTAMRLLSQGLIPSTAADTIIHYDSRCYSGQFSVDGNFFFSCGQDFRVRMYDTSNPHDWKYYKTVVHPCGHWTITDASLSPDNRFLAYSSIRKFVCLAATDPNEHSEPYLLDFSSPGTGHRPGFGDSFGIWSIRFSGDGREIVAGAQDDSVYVYDIETRQTILKIRGHENDVNAVCFADDSSPHILYSGSDDTTLKVWDRRSMGDGREAGVFLGHTEGLTYVDSKGDGRYVLSNGKDQTMKLWDLRKMMTTDRLDRIDPSSYASSSFDYRFMTYDELEYKPHPHDCSLVTFRGHRVLKTLIRCHFSPPGSTDSRYVYSGSENGSVYVYNLDATLAARINVRQATDHARPGRGAPLGGTDDGYGRRSAWKTCVRDASWHPNAPIIAATSWNGWNTSSGTCSVHSWNDGAADDEGEPAMGTRVDQRLQRDDELYATQSSDLDPSRRWQGRPR
ncbi:MAG: hypothetical protein M1832_006070 [Thelocarpon impressellum]|nr:MAG: hypothetical protein M1832_006070 [Thelocarpon impressellum]